MRIRRAFSTTFGISMALAVAVATAITGEVPESRTPVASPHRLPQSPPASPGSADEPPTVTPDTEIPLPGEMVPVAPPPPSSKDDEGGVQLKDPMLRELVERWRAGERASELAGIVEVTDGRVRVEVVPAEPDGDTSAALAATDARDIAPIISGLVAASIEVDRLEAAERRREVGYLRLPEQTSTPAGAPALAGAAGTTFVTSAALRASVRTAVDEVRTGANGGQIDKRVRAGSWHRAGYTGKGVKVGIIDYFDKPTWDWAQSMGDLKKPAGSFCRSNGVACNIWTYSPSTHGPAVAEGVLDVAPRAQLYIASVNTNEDLRAAIDYFHGKGVRIITRSLGSPVDGPGDGTGESAALVDYAVSRGITWFNSAGNKGRFWDNAGSRYVGQYWRGRWVDNNSDGWLDIVDPNGFYNAQDRIYAQCDEYLLTLRWSDWGAGPGTDYDLYIYSYPADTLIGKSEWDQGDPTVAPLENSRNAACSPGSTIYYKVWKYSDGNGSGSDVLEMFSGYRYMYDYVSNAGSAGAQGFVDSKNSGLLSVGAVGVGTRKALALSSRGPTNDRRIKPDLSAASEYNTTSDGGTFGGTSAASPVAAGVAALLRQRYPSWSAKKLGSYMRSHAVKDRGAKGSDNAYGTGEVRMPLLNTKKPKISGSRAVGKKLTAVSGKWTETVKRKYQWLRNGKAIKGATGKTYTLKAKDRGKRISVRETGARSTYKSVAAVSGKTKKIA